MSGAGFVQFNLPGALGNPKAPLASTMAGAYPLPPDMGQAGSEGNQAVDFFKQYFGVPINRPPKNYNAARDINIMDNDQAYMHQYLDIATRKLTYEIVTANSAPLLSTVARVVIDWVQNVHATSTSWNIIPAQPISIMGQAKYNSRNSLEYILQGRRVAAAALERMEILMSPDYGAQAADFMIKSTATSIVFEKQHDVLAALRSGYFIRWFLETDGERFEQFDNYERELENQMQHFGAFNRSIMDAEAAIAKAKAYVDAGSHIVFLPYNMKNEFRKLRTTTKPQDQLAMLELTARGRDMLGMLIDRSEAYSASATREQATVLASDGSTQIYLGPPSSLEPGFTDVGYGALNSVTQFAGFARSSSLTPQGQTKNFFGDVIMYDGQSDQPKPIMAAAALRQTGWFGKRETGAAGFFPNFSPTDGAFSDHAHQYIARLNKTPGPDGYATLATVEGLLQNNELVIDNQAEVLKTSHMHVFATYGTVTRDGKDSGVYEAAQTIGAMYPDAMPHGLTLRGGRAVRDGVEKESRKSNGSYTAQMAFRDLRTAINMLIDIPVPTQQWCDALVLANPSEGVTSLIDQCMEFPQAPNGSINIPKYRDGLSTSYLHGCWSGPMLRAIARLSPSFFTDDAPSWVREVQSLLIKCLPVVDSSLDRIKSVLPETMLLATNLAPAWFCQQPTAADALTMLIANEFGDIPLFFRTDKSSEQTPTDPLVNEFIEALFVGDSVLLQSNASDAALDKIVSELDSKTVAALIKEYKVLAGKSPSAGFNMETLKNRQYLILLAVLAGVVKNTTPDLSPENLLRKTVQQISEFQAATSKSTSRADFKTNQTLVNWVAQFTIISRSEQTGATKTGAYWRSPLCYAGRTARKGNASVVKDYIYPGGFSINYMGPIVKETGDGDLLIDGTVGYVNAAQLRSVNDANVRVAKKSTARRAAFYGAPAPTGTGPVSGNQISSPTMQNFRSRVQLGWHQLRMQAYDAEHGDSDWFSRICWRAYIETPLTFHSVSKFFSQERDSPFRGLQPPCDIAFMKLSQTFFGGDLMCTTSNAVELRTQPATGYLAQDMTHKLVTLQADIRSLCWMPNPRLAMMLHSVYVEPRQIGRSNGLIRPGTSRDINEWLSAKNNENTLVVLEKVTVPWNGVLSVTNTFSQYIRRANSVLGTLKTCLWTSMAFCMVAFAEYLALGRTANEYARSISKKVNNSISSSGSGTTVLQGSRSFLDAATKSRTHMTVTAPYIFRQWHMERNEEGGFSVENVGEPVFPLGHEYWNQAGLRSVLSKGLVPEPTLKHQMVTYA